MVLSQNQKKPRWSCVSEELQVTPSTFLKTGDAIDFLMIIRTKPNSFFIDDAQRFLYRLYNSESDFFYVARLYYPVLCSCKTSAGSNLQQLGYVFVIEYNHRSRLDEDDLAGGCSLKLPTITTDSKTIGIPPLRFSSLCVSPIDDV